MRVLIVDKIPGMRSALKLLLLQFKEIDYIAEIGNGENLLNKIIAESPDIVLIDWDFLGSKTKDIVISLKVNYPNISTVVLSSNLKLKNKYFKKGIDDFIIKGYPPERLYNALKYLVNKNKDKKVINKK